MTRIIRNGNYRIAENGVNVYSFEIAAVDKLASPGILPFYTNVRKIVPLRIGKYDIIPHGEQNRLPTELREILDDNNLTPEIINKLVQLLWGQGPALYETRFEEGKRVKYFVEEKEVQTWLDSWGYEDYLLKAIVEFRHMNGHFTKYYRNRAPRIGGPGKIVRLEHVGSVKARLEWPNTKENIRHIIVGDWDQPWKKGLKSFPLFNRFEPFRFPVSMRYSNMYSFALDNDYSRPTFNGSLNWIRLGSSIAKLLINFNSNSAAIKYHIKSPAIYWQKKKEELEEKCKLKDEEYTDNMLEDLKDNTFLKITEALSGVVKAGKMLTTEEIYDEIGNEYVGWKVEVLDQKVKSFIEAQINISKRAALETTSGLGLHPALSNISTDGNLPSGSEQLYAFKLFLSTGVDIPESIVCRDINNSIAANFPGKTVKLGFYHDVVHTEETVTPSQRLKNQK